MVAARPRVATPQPGASNAILALLRAPRQIGLTTLVLVTLALAANAGTAVTDPAANGKLTAGKKYIVKGTTTAYRLVVSFGTGGTGDSVTSAPANWSVDVTAPAAAGANTLKVVSFDAGGANLGTTTVDITIVP